ncbi:uncharacterized protein SAMN05216582_12015 [Selenomonas ruminantium]|uniref:TPM domain-containing protein n=1 Tax=Selenomonas ruminantium TaxID=971 RepID=A0A1M6VR14_SELRU|nr:TPM domain-containing protein [Selenomonas ruminantium]SHK83775.1 uncharacterized protein SAMN05216582_12015 [Selenomonas ruminantium]
MKKLMIHLALAVVCIAMVLGSAAPVMAAAQQAQVEQKAARPAKPETVGPVVDQAKILTQAQVGKLTEKIKAVEEKHQVKIGIYIMQSLPAGMVAGKMANNVLDKYYANGQNGSIVLLLAMGSRDWYISTDNTMRQRIVDGVGIDGLKEMFLEDLSDGNYAESFGAFVDGVDKYLAYYEETGEPYDPAEEFSWVAAVVAVLVALVFGWGFREYLISCMSNVAPAAEASAYLKQGSFQLAQSHDNYLYTTVTRVAKSKDNDSSSSSSDSSHGGGGGKF